MDRKKIADTSGIIAFLDRDDKYHSQAVNIVIKYFDPNIKIQQKKSEKKIMKIRN